MNPNYNTSQKLTSKGLKTTLIGIIISFVLAVIKIVTGVFGNSYALIADGIESLTDIFTSIAVMTGLFIASKPADLNHPYGHGKAEPLAGIVVAMGIFIAAIIIIIQSIYEIITPHHAPAGFTLLVLIIVVLTKEILFRYMIKVGENVGSVAIRSNAWHHRSDSITSLAAFIGISIALIGGEGYEIADDCAALFASLIIMFNSYRLLKPALYELMDTAPSMEFIEEVKLVASEVPGVVGLDKCYIRKMGFNYLVDIHVIVKGNKQVSEGHYIAHQVKEKLLNIFSKISDVLVHIEPDIKSIKEK